MFVTCNRSNLIAPFAALLLCTWLVPGELCFGSPSDDDTQNAKEGVTVRGRVMNPDDSPAVKADVHLLRVSSGSYTLPVTTIKTTTDAEGNYEFTNVAIGKYKLWSETPQFTSLKKKLGGRIVEVKPDMPGQDPLRLHKGCRYRVTLLSKLTGEPIAGGRVWFGWTDLDRLYHAGDDKVVNIDGLGVDDWYFVVTAPGHEIQYKKIPEQPLGSTTELEFRLGLGGSVKGVVTDDDGKPISKAKVTVSAASGGMVPRYGQVFTNDRGEYEIANLPLGTSLRVSVGKEQYKGGESRVVIPNGSVEQDENFSLSLIPYGGDCIIRVVDAEGRPIEGAELHNTGNSTALNRRVTTDGEGRGHLKDLYESFQGRVVFVRATGYVTQKTTVPKGTAEQPAEAEIRLQKGKTLRGVVVDPEGKPRSKIRVYYNEGEHPWTVGGRVVTDEKGEFVIHGLPDRSTLTVYTPRPYAPIRDLPVDVAEGKPIKINMELDSVVKVRAIDKATGRPIEEFNVKVRNSPDRQDGDPWGSFSTSFSEQGVNVMGDKKSFLMEGLELNTPLQVTVSAKGYKTQVIPRVLAIRRDQAKSLDVQMPAESPDDYETISGTILLKNGTPVAGASVCLVVGSVNPVSDAARERGGTSDNWRFYHWDLVEGGDIARGKPCLQFLTTATDKTGAFRFEKVRRDGSWIELFHQGGNAAPQRFPDLRKRFPDSLIRLGLTASKPSSLVLSVDQKRWSEAKSVRLEKPFYTEYPDCVETPFSSESRTIEAKTQQVKFQNLPAGVYRVTIEGTPVPVGNGGIRTTTLGRYMIEIPEGAPMEGDL